MAMSVPAMSALIMKGVVSSDRSASSDVVDGNTSVNPCMAYSVLVKMQPSSVRKT